MRLGGPVRGLFDSLTSLLHRARLARRRPLRFAALHGPVEVITDSWGVPHIWADSTDDLFFAQGYVTARDRLFQMDYNRHAARGRISEMLGNRPLPWRTLTVHLKERTTLDADIMVRTFGMEAAAQASLPLHSEPARRMLASYTAGVNAFLATHPSSLEHFILGRLPPPWSDIDSLVMLKAMGFELNFAWRSILLGAMLHEAGLPPHIARLLSPGYPEHGPTITGSWERAAAPLEVVRQAEAAELGWGAPGAGSNCFAVAGGEGRGALLANDTHLAMLAPVPWHEVHLHGGGLDLHGFALVGVPGVGIGRTKKFAWGITAGLVQDLDLFLEEMHPEDPTRYRTPEGFAELATREEIFRVRGEGYVRRSIQSSRHGPLLENVGAPLDARYRYAVAWTGHTPSRELDSLWEVWHADSPESFGHALRHHGCPTFNMTYAGADGRIAYFLAGKIPKRRPGTPLRPLEGWSGEWDWQGEVPYEENPREIDPPRGFIVTANNRVAPRDYPYELGGLFEPPERFLHIVRRLTELGRSATLADLAALQGDQHSRWGPSGRAVMLRIAGGVGGIAPEPQSIERVAAQVWLAWDGDASARSAGAAVGYAALHLIGDELVRRLAGDDAAFAFLELGSFIGTGLVELEKHAEALAALGVDVRDVVRTGFRRAVALIVEALGSDPDRWSWGELHPLWMRHRFHTTALGRLFSTGPEPAGGGPDTVNRGDMSTAVSFELRVGAALRFLVDAGDPRSGASVLPGGQSGSRLSPHFDDQLADFLDGRSKGSPMGREGLVAESVETFLPAGRSAPAAPQGEQGGGGHHH